MSATLTAPVVTIECPRRADGTENRAYRRVHCTCGFRGQLVPVRTIDGFDVVEREVDQHRFAHENHTGFFDYVNGWTAS